ncbi:MAG: SDR family NAD(P)-dependent oxidoreductase [Clostridia bacterium]|nr:SDR family NAD(P)-dependent oxidoreductase [Clostridia bacterium]
MKNWLKNEYVVLSGASGGIGRQLCKLLIERYGANVIGIGRDESKMLSLKSELKENAEAFSYRIFDVSNESAWLALKAELTESGVSPVLLINNAGAFPVFQQALNTSPQTVEKILQVNFLSAVYSCSTLSDILKTGGGIVNVCSAAALCPIVGTAAYSASKSAMKGYTEALAMEERGRRYVGIVYPGTTATDLFRDDKNTENSALQKIAMKPEKMAKKLARVIYKKRKRAVLGWDAKLMNITAKIAPVRGLALIAWVMKKSGSKVFSNVFENKKKGE